MIRSVSHHTLKEALGDAAFAALLSEKRARDLALEASVIEIARRWKAGEIAENEKLSLESTVYEDYESWALGAGVYESVSQSEIDEADETGLVDGVISVGPVRLLKIITRITNYYRNLKGKSALTESQVATRLLA